MIVPPMDVLDAGRMAIFSDPVGAVIGVWQPNAHKGAGIVNEPGTLTWNELVTTDTAAAQSFYDKVFGWGAVTHGEGPGAYTEFQVAGRSIAGMMERPAEMPEMPPVLGRLLQRRRHRRDGEAGRRAGRDGRDATARHRAGTLRGRGRPVRSNVPGAREQGVNLRT